MLFRSGATSHLATSIQHLLSGNYGIGALVLVRQKLQSRAKLDELFADDGDPAALARCHDLSIAREVLALVGGLEYQVPTLRCSVDIKDLDREDLQALAALIKAALKEYRGTMSEEFWARCS